MRRKISIACAAAMALAASNTFAITPASQNTRGTGYLVLAEDLSNWHLAAYGAAGTRTLEDNNFEKEIDVSRYAAILGYDLTRWMTIYGLVGTMEAEDKYGYGNDDGDSSLLLGAGAWMNLLQSEELTLLSTVSYYKVTAGAEVSFADLDNYTWGQFDGYLTFGIVNELENNTMIFPETIGIFTGPVFSYVFSDELEMDSSNVFGMTVGLSMTFTRTTYATISYDFLRGDDDIFAGMIGVRF